MDTNTQALIALLHPKLREEATTLVNEINQSFPTGVQMRITSTLRTFDEQTKLFNQGRTTPGAIITNSKAGQSFHNYNLALDYNLNINGKTSWAVDTNWMHVANTFKKAGYTFGGDWIGFKDHSHLEKTFGYTWEALLLLHNAGDFISGSTYLNI